MMDIMKRSQLDEGYTAARYMRGAGPGHASEGTIKSSKKAFDQSAIARGSRQHVWAHVYR